MLKCFATLTATGYISAFFNNIVLRGGEKHLLLGDICHLCAARPTGNITYAHTQREPSLPRKEKKKPGVYFITFSDFLTQFSMLSKTDILGHFG